VQGVEHLGQADIGHRSADDLLHLDRGDLDREGCVPTMTRYSHSASQAMIAPSYLSHGRELRCYGQPLSAIRN
jgi:hypothetical protein